MKMLDKFKCFSVNDFFLEDYVTSEGAVFHNVLYYQPLPITRYQVSFMLSTITIIIQYL